MKDLHERTGAVIQKAAKDLPEGYEITIQIEKDAGIVILHTPPKGEHFLGESISDFGGDDIAWEIEHAIEYAIQHKLCEFA